MKDKFKITGAAARSKTEFAIGLNIFPLDAEDPYTILLTYDGTLDQPWSRSDANRNLSDITDSKDIYFGLSDEEFVYTFDDKGLNSEEIKGMGIHADNATEGAGLAIHTIESTVFIAGQGRQVYRQKDKDKWEKLPIDGMIPGEKQKDVDLKSIDGSSEKDLIICGETLKASHFNRELQNKMNDAIDADDDDELLRLIKIKNQEKPKPEGRAYHYDGSDWTQIDVENYFPKTVFVDSQNRAWLGCDKGTMLQIERDEDGEFDVDDIEIIEDSRTDIYSITEFQGRLIMASSEGLFAYDENFESLEDEIVRIKPKLNKKLHTKPSPLKVQAVDDVMYYFDYPHPARAS